MLRSIDPGFRFRTADCSCGWGGTPPPHGSCIHRQGCQTPVRSPPHLFGNLLPILKLLKVTYQLLKVDQYSQWGIRLYLACSKKKLKAISKTAAYGFHLTTTHVMLNWMLNWMTGCLVPLYLGPYQTIWTPWKRVATHATGFTHILGWGLSGC
jgi:hypothetical protein